MIAPIEGQGAFGATSAPSSFGVQQTAAAPSFGSTSPPSFGGFGQSQPAFGGAATFGGSTLFGSKPTFGGGATFGSPVNSGVAAKSEAGDRNLLCVFLIYFFLIVIFLKRIWCLCCFQ